MEHPLRNPRLLEISEAKSPGSVGGVDDVTDPEGEYKKLNALAAIDHDTFMTAAARTVNCFQVSKAPGFLYKPIRSANRSASAPK